MVKRIKSGIIGFDPVIEGGFVENSVNLISGGTGTGKTLFSLQFIVNGAKQFGDRGLYFTIEESETDLKGDIESVGLDEGKANYLNNIKFVQCPLYETTNFLLLIDQMLTKFKPKRVVIDSISALAMPMEDNFERRKEMYRIIELLKQRNCTSLLTSEVAGEGALSAEAIGTLSRYKMAEFLCDSVTALYYAGIGGQSDRALRVIKMRRTNHLRGPIPMSIGKLGIKVLKSKI